jgi:hypothetical protein
MSASVAFYGQASCGGFITSVSSRFHDERAPKRLV